MRRRVLDRAPTEHGRLLVVERRGLTSTDGSQVEVGDHLVDDVGVVLHEDRPGLDVAGGAEAAQHRLAEPVGRGDGGLVEPRDRRTQAPTTGGALGVVDVEEKPLQGVTLVAVPGSEDGVGLHEPLAHAVLELGAGRPAEGDDEQLVERGDPLGHEPGDEGRDRPRLAGAGAGLEQGGAGGQRVGDVELDDRCVGAHASTSIRSSSGNQSVAACCSKPRSTRSAIGASGPRTRRW